MESDSPPRACDLTGVILAGGRAQRLGGLNKGLLDLAGLPLVAWAIRALAPQVGPLLISANRELERYRSLGHPVAQDLRPGFPGPLAGIATALAAATTPWVLCVPCDAPLVPADLAARLAAALGTTGADLAIAHDGRRLQPLHALIPVTLAGHLNAYLDAGKHAVRGWYGDLRIAQADFSEQAPSFVNLNTPEDLRRLEQALGPSSAPRPI